MIKIYTDGSSTHTKIFDGHGASAFVAVLDNNIIAESSSYESKNKIGHCELRAIEMGLHLIWDNAQINLPAMYEIHSDSRYAINTITKWSKNWKALNWMRPDGGKVENLNLVKRLYFLNKKYGCPILKVKAHSNHVFNDRADYLARQAMMTQKSIPFKGKLPKIDSPFNIILD